MEEFLYKLLIFVIWGSVGMALTLYIFVSIIIFRIFKKPYKWIIIILLNCLIFSVLGKVMYDKKQKQIVEAEKKAEKKARYEKAKTVFDEQCKKAGEKIYRTVEVEGIVLLKLQGKVNCGKVGYCGYDQMWEDAVFGNVGYSRTEEDYIKSFLNKGYQYVDVLNKDNPYNDDNYIIRYTRTEPQPYSALNVEYHPDNPARYVVTYENDLSLELRKHWIAGSTIKIIDRKTDELLAEKTIFAFHRGLGMKYGKGYNDPWWNAVRCGRFGYSPIQDFAITVLKPRPLVLENEIPEQSIQKQ